MYIDHDNAPASIIVSPLLNRLNIAIFVAVAAVAVVAAAEVAIKLSPIRARPHPPQTYALMRSPAITERRGVKTTLVCVRKDALAAEVCRSPAFKRPCTPSLNRTML